MPNFKKLKKNFLEFLRIFWTLETFSKRKFQNFRFSGIFWEHKNGSFPNKGSNLEEKEESRGPTDVINIFNNYHRCENRFETGRSELS